MNTHPPKGGARPGAGRKALPEGEAMVPVTVNLKPAQRDKLKRLGGAPWVRKKIDQAKEPEATMEQQERSTATTTTGELRVEALETLRQFKEGKISRTELEKETKKINAVTRQMRTDLRAAKQAHKAASKK